MPLTPYAQKLCLDWLCRGATPTQPPARFLSWATATPTATSAFDGPFTPLRVTAKFAAANSPAGSASNNTAISATVSGVAAFTAKGVNIWDGSPTGTRLLYGGIVDLGCKSGDNPVFSVGALKVTIA
jgi:hypothetical protein